MSPAEIGVATLVVALVLLASNRVRFDVVAVIVLAILGLSGAVGAPALFVGFSATPTVVIASMLVLGGGLRRTGAIDVLARAMLRVAHRWPTVYRPVMLAFAALPSAFVSDVGLMGIMLPTVLSLRRRLRLSAPAILMPLAVSIALGGLLTMVGSAGNIIANGDLSAAHRPPLGLFAITPIGLAVVAVGLVVLIVAGRWLLPKGANDPDDERAPGGTELLDLDCLAELRLAPAAAVVGDGGAAARDRPTAQQLAVQLSGGDDRQVTLLGSVDEHGQLRRLPAEEEVVPGSRLLVRGRAAELFDSGLLAPASAPTGGGQGAGSGGGQGAGSDGGQGAGSDVSIVEVLVPPGSPLAGRTLQQADMGRHFHVDPLAVAWRRGLKLGPLAGVRLSEGDVVLGQALQGQRDARVPRGELLVLAHLEHHLRPVSWRTVLSVLIVAGALGMVAVNALALTVALLAGSVALVVTGCLTLDDAYQAIDWRLIFLLGGFIPLGNLLQRSGVIGRVGRFVASTAGRAGPEALLAVFFVLAALLTQVLSNAATALVLSPLALSVAGTQHLSPTPLLIAVVVAVSASPLTPLANKVYLMTTGPGRYRYRDFLRIGILVTAASLSTTLVLAPALFPFHR